MKKNNNKQPTADCVNIFFLFGADDELDMGFSYYHCYRLFFFRFPLSFLLLWVLVLLALDV